MRIDARARLAAAIAVLLAAPTLVAAQTSDAVTSSPRTFPARLQVLDTNGNPLVEVSFADYIRGVLKAEIEGELNATALGLSNAQKIEALKAQALAAQSYYLRNANRSACGNASATPPTFRSSIACQVFAQAPWSQNTLTAVTSADVSSRAITMNGSVIESLYFDKTPDGFTTNAEAADGFYSSNLRKEITPEFFTGAAPANRRHGLSQRGTGVLAGPGTVFNQGALAILQHYYGPLCPVVKRIRVTQSGQTKYEHFWTDNNDFTAADIQNPAPTRTLMPGTDIAQRSVAPVGAGTGATLLIEFSEQVISPGAGIEVVVGGRTLTGGVRTRPFPANPVPEFWTFNMSPEFLNSLAEPTATIEVRGVNAAAANLAIDGNPGTFAFRQYGGAITACDPSSTPGAPIGDSLASFIIDQTAPTITMFAKNMQGDVILDESTTATSTIHVVAIDSDTAHPTAGVAQIGILSLTRDFTDVRTFNGAMIAETTFIDLPDDDYWIFAIDEAGNQKVTSVRVARHLPVVSLGSIGFRVLNFQGIWTSPPLTTLGGNNELGGNGGPSIFIQDFTGLGIDEISIAGPNGFSIIRTFPSIETQYREQFNSQFPVGFYTLRARNKEGNETEVEFQVVDISLKILPGSSSAVFNPASERYDLTIVIRATSTLNLKSIQRWDFDPITGVPLLTNEQNISGTDHQLSIFLPSGCIGGECGSGPTFLIKDVAGNRMGWGFQLFANFSNPSPSPPPISGLFHYLEGGSDLRIPPITYGSNLSLDFGLGFRIDQVDTTNLNDIGIEFEFNLMAGKTPGALNGYHLHPKGGSYFLYGSAGQLIPGPYRISIDYDNTGLTPEQQQGVKIAHFTNRSGTFEIRPAQNNPGQVSFMASSADFVDFTLGLFAANYLLLIPDFSNPISAGTDGIAFLSNTVITVAVTNPAEPAIQQLLNTFQAQGKSLASGIFRLGPTGTSFSPPGVVTMPYSPATLSQLGLSEAKIAIYQFTESGDFEKLLNQNIDTANQTVTARVGQFSSLFAIFGDTVPFTPQPGSVNAPSSAIIAAVNLSSITLKWQANGNPTGTSYAAQISTNNFSTISASNLTSSTSAVFADLFSNTTYFLRVQAFNPDSSGTAFSVAMPTSTLAAAPTSADPIDVSSTSITARWGANNNSATTRYTAEISTSNSFIPIKAAITSLNLSAIFGGLSPNTTYYSRVAALGNNGRLTAFTVLPATMTLTVLGSGAAVSAVFDPDTIKLKSHAKAITIVLEVTEARSAADIDINSLRISAINGVPLVPALFPLAKPPAKLGDANHNRIRDLRVNFDQEALGAALPVEERSRVTVTGRFKDGSPFVVETFVSTTKPGKKVMDISLAAADPTFRLVDIYAFPNPVRGGKKLTIRIQVGLADLVNINIYDIAGNAVHSDSVVNPQIIDDGNGKGAQYTYDYIWNGSGAASGVYVYAVSAKKSGAPLIHKLGKAALIK